MGKSLTNYTFTSSLSIYLSLSGGLDNLTSLHKRLFPTKHLAEPRQNDGGA